MGAPARLSEPSGTVEAVTVAGDGALPPGARSTSIALWAVGRTDGVRPAAVGPSARPIRSTRPVARLPRFTSEHTEPSRG